MTKTFISLFVLAAAICMSGSTRSPKYDPCDPSSPGYDPCNCPFIPEPCQ